MPTSWQIIGIVIDDTFTHTQEVIIETAGENRLIMGVYLLPEHQQHLLKIGKKLSITGQIDGQRIIKVEGEASFS